MGLSATCIIVIGFCIERIIAMKYIEKYDQMFRPIPWLGITILSFSICYSAVLLALWYTGIVRSKIIYLVQIGIFSCSSFFFIGIKISSVRAYHRVANCRNASINQRFQTAQNFKAARLLIYLAPYKCATSLLVLVFYMLVFETTEKAFQPLYTELFFLFNYAQVSIQMMLVVTCHDTLRKYVFGKYFCGKKRSRVRDGRLHSVTGNQMKFGADEEVQIYFNTLQQSWQIQ